MDFKNLRDFVPKSIFLSGSGGFVGKNLKSFFNGKYKLFTPRSFELDLRDESAVKEYFKKNNIDFIIHCGTTGGARGIEDAKSTIDDNIAMVDNLLKYKKENAPVILFGSGAMYDKSRELKKVKETEIGKFEPEDLYGKSKMLIAKKIKNREDVLCLNIFACYGYGEKDSRFPSYAINQVLKSENILINQNVIFDYLFIEDLQKIVEYFVLYKPCSNIINITPDKSVSLIEIANIVNGFGNKKVEILTKTDKMNNEYTGDNTLLLKNIQNFEFTPIEEGLKKLYDYKKSGVNINEK